MALSSKPGSSSQAVSGNVQTEFDILQASHRFIRHRINDEMSEGDQLWGERLAENYYSSLYREYAVCDLKHYKSGNFALRWRTESEVISGEGEITCGNTRCPLHAGRGNNRPSLKTLELPFSYVEKGEDKFALVKVVLCEKCCKKLMWKRNKEKKEQQRARAQYPDSDKEEGNAKQEALRSQSTQNSDRCREDQPPSRSNVSEKEHASRKRRRSSTMRSDDRSHSRHRPSSPQQAP